MPSPANAAKQPGSPVTKIVAATFAFGLSAAVLAWAMGWFSTPGRSRLEGRVSVDGRPVTFGVVTVVTADGATLTARIGPDGTYSLPHVPPGPVRIAVSSPEPKTVFQKAAEASAVAAPGGRAVAPGGAARSSSGNAGGVPPPSDGSKAIAMKVEDGPPSSRQPARPEHAGWFRIPGRYANPLQSGLGGSVAAEGGTINLELSAAAAGK